jgi:hypothetical protein
MVNRDIDAVCTVVESATSYIACDQDEYKVDRMDMTYDMNDLRSQGIILPKLFYWRKEGQR